MATWLFEPSQATSLTNRGANKRLISYYHTKEKEDLLPDYVRIGILPEKNK